MCTYNTALTNNVWNVPKFAKLSWIFKFSVDNNALNSFATCKRVFPNGHSKSPMVVFTAGFCATEI